MKVKDEIREAEGKAVSITEGAEKALRLDRYLWVFFLILLTILSSAFASDGSWGLILTLSLQTATLLVALRTSDAGPKSQLVAAAVAMLTVLGVALAVITGNERTARLAYAVSMLALVAVTPIAIVRRVMSHPTVNVATITGAANIYLLFGLFWASAYSFVGALLHQGSQSPAEAFFVASRTPMGSDFIYYSYTTLATVGYGDLTASSQIGRMMSITEALIGQLYLVIVVSVLVANVGRHRLQPLVARSQPPAAEEPPAE
jgi:hypothetical protein